MASREKSTAAASGTAGKSGMGIVKLRRALAQLVWLVCVVAASFLAVGALLVALDANERNELVKFVLSGAAFFDLTVFDRDNGVLKFEGANSDTKNALFNWGLCAVVWLVVGRILERLIRP